MNVKSRCQKVAEDYVKRSGKGSKREPEGIPKADEIDVEIDV